MTADRARIDAYSLHSPHPSLLDFYISLTTRELAVNAVSGDHAADHSFATGIPPLLPGLTFFITRLPSPRRIRCCLRI